MLRAEVINKIRRNEPIYIFAILFIGAYLCFYSRALFGEYANTAQDKGSASKDESGAGEAGGEGKWFIIKNSNFTIYCDQSADLNTIAARLGRRGLFTSGIYGPNPVSAPPEKIAYRMNMLLKRVKEILYMYPNLPGLKIKIFKDRDELDGEYFKMFGSKVDYKSFYVYGTNTIYTSEEDISDSVVAHEMGHAVVDHYFSVTPPPKIAEMLAQYVDIHLED